MPQFQLHSVEDVRIGDYSLIGIQSITSLSPQLLFSLKQKFQEREFPLTLTVLLQVRNYAEESHLRSVPISFRKIDWELILDNRSAVQGTIEKTIYVPATDSVLIPITATVNLFDFLQARNLTEFLEFALSLAGKQGTQRIAVDIQPTIEIPIVGLYRYPRKIRVVSTEFRG